MNAAVAEALADPRIGPVSGEALATEAARWDEVETEAEAEREVEEARRGRAIEWATQTVTQGEILDAFCDYCRDELDDVDVLDATRAASALLAPRAQHGRDTRGVTRSASARRRGPGAPARPDRPEGDGALPRRRGPARPRRGLRPGAAGEDRRGALELFVYFEWFLRDLYGVKILPANAFTRASSSAGSSRSAWAEPPRRACTRIPPPWVGE